MVAVQKRMSTRFTALECSRNSSLFDLSRTKIHEQLNYLQIAVCNVASSASFLTMGTSFELPEVKRKYSCTRNLWKVGALGKTYGADLVSKCCPIAGGLFQAARGHIGTYDSACYAPVDSNLIYQVRERKEAAGITVERSTSRNAAQTASLSRTLRRFS